MTNYTQQISISSYANKMIKPRFNKKQLDIYYSIIYVALKNGTSKVNLKLNDLIYYLKDKRSHRKRIESDLAKFNYIMQFDKFLDDRGRLISKPVIMAEYSTGSEIETLEFSPSFYAMLTDYSKGHINFSLSKLVLQPSKYSKEIYTRLCQYKTTGKWRVYRQDLENYLGVPDRLRDTKTLVPVVLLPAIKNMSYLFKGLNVKVYKKGRRIVSYEFYFKPFKKHRSKANEAEEKT